MIVLSTLAGVVIVGLALYRVALYVGGLLAETHERER